MQFKKGEQNATIIELQMDLGDLGPASLFELGHELKSKLRCKRENRIEFGLYSPASTLQMSTSSSGGGWHAYLQCFSWYLKKCNQLIVWTSLLNINVSLFFDGAIDSQYLLVILSPTTVVAFGILPERARQFELLYF